LEEKVTVPGLGNREYIRRDPLSVNFGNNFADKRLSVGIVRSRTRPRSLVYEPWDSPNPQRLGYALDDRGIVVPFPIGTINFSVHTVPTDSSIHAVSSALGKSSVGLISQQWNVKVTFLRLLPM
jgi:hypothetical protein